MTPITEPAPLTFCEQAKQCLVLLLVGVVTCPVLFIIGDWWAL